MRKRPLPSCQAGCGVPPGRGTDAPGPCLEALEERLLLTMNPTGLEQEMLERINDMRTNPAAHLATMVTNFNPITSPDADIQSALDFFSVSGTQLQTEWATLTAAPPLAWNEILLGTALAHNQKMIQYDDQEHVLPGEQDLGARILAAGYSYSIVAENIYGYAESVLHGHAAFAIDWGGGGDPDGMQDPPGHRNNIMDSAFREMGISIVPNSAPADLEPLVVTQDFGNRPSLTGAYLLGVVFEDGDGDQSYDSGEGKGQVTVTITGPGGPYVTTTMDAGGYQALLGPGSYTVEFSGGPLPGTISQPVTVGSDNVKLDAMVDTAPPGDASGFTATAEDSDVALSWTNPPDSDFAGVKILRKTGGYPANAGDGTTVYDGAGTSHTDSAVIGGTRYYYKAFAYDGAGNYAGGVTGDAMPQVGWQQVGIGDFNNDGQSDILWRNTGTGRIGVSLMNTGASTGWLEMQTVSFTDWELLGAADINRDGHDDIVWRNRNNNVVGAWLMNNGIYTGWLGMQAVSYADWEASGFGDFNKDGHVDILWRNKNDNRLGARLLNDGQNVDWLAMGTVSYATWECGGPGDINGDGQVDILWRNRNTYRVGAWLMNAGVYVGWLDMGTVSYAAWDLLGVGSFNADAHLDILWRSDNPGELGAWLMNAGTRTGWLDVESMTYAGWQLGVVGDYADLELGGSGDFNEDGHDDILWRHKTTNVVGVWLMDGGRYIGWLEMETVSYAGWELGGIGDFNGDTHVDILWRNKATDAVGAWLMNAGAYTGWLGMQSVSSANWAFGGVGDFNGDGHVDILWRNKNDNRVGAWLMTNGVYTGWLAMQTVSYADWEACGIGDFNNDSHVDILWRNVNTNVLGAWLLNNGVYTGWLGMQTVVYSAWESGGLGDFNDDGDLDILWRSRNVSRLGAWLMDAGVYDSWLEMGSA